MLARVFSYGRRRNRDGMDDGVDEESNDTHEYGSHGEEGEEEVLGASAELSMTRIPGRNDGDDGNGERRIEREQRHQQTMPNLSTMPIIRPMTISALSSAQESNNRAVSVSPERRKSLRENALDKMKRLVVMGSPSKSLKQKQTQNQKEIKDIADRSMDELDLMQHHQRGIGSSSLLSGENVWFKLPQNANNNSNNVDKRDEKISDDLTQSRSRSKSIVKVPSALPTSPSSSSSLLPVPVRASRLPIPVSSNSVKPSLQRSESTPVAPTPTNRTTTSSFKRSLPGKNKAVKSAPSLPSQSSSNSSTTKSLPPLTPYECAIARRAVNQWLEFTIERRKLAFAKLYHEERTARNIMSAWKLLVWESKKEWKLEVKADIHYKYASALKVWLAWRKYIHMQHEEKKKILRAERLARYHLLQRAFRAWHLYNTQRRYKTFRKEHATSQHHLFLQVRYFWIWKQQTDLEFAYKSLEVEACETWRKFLIRRFWHVWRNELTSRRIQLEKHVKADMFLREKLLQKCINSFATYVGSRKQKRAIMGTGMQVCEQRLLKGAFKEWKVALQDRIHERELTLIADQVFIRKCRARYLRVWQKYAELSANERYQESLADVNYAHLLGKRIIRALQTAMNDYTIADRYYEQRVLKQYVLRWKKAFAQKLLAKEVEMMMPGVVYWRTKWVQACWGVWRGHVAARKHERVLAQRAQSFRTRHVLKTLLQTWQDFIKEQQLEQRQQRTSQQFHTFSLYRRTFTIWRQRLEHNRHIQSMTKQAQLISNQKTMKWVMESWNRAIESRKHDREQTALAIAHDQRLTLTKAVQAWRSYIVLEKYSIAANRTALKLRRWKLLKRGYLCWLYRLHERRRARQEESAAMQLYQNRLVGQVFQNWKLFVDKSVRLQTRYEQTRRNLQRQTVVKYLNYWRLRLTIRQYRQRLALEQTKREELESLRKAFGAWMCFTRLHVHKRDVRNRKILLVGDAVKKIAVQSAFARWKAYVAERHRKQALDTVAIKFHKQQLTKSVLRSWKSRYVTRQRIHVLSAQADVFNTTRLLKCVFNAWLNRKTIDEWKQLYHRRHILPVQHHDKTVLRTSFKSWLTVVSETKRRQARLSQALEWHQEHLWKTSLLAWMHVADDMIVAKRSRGKQASGMDDRAWSLALKYGLRWRRVVRERKLQSFIESRGGIGVYRNETEESVERFVREVISRPMPMPVVIAEAKKLDVSGSSALSSGLKATSVVNTATVASRPAPRKPKFLMTMEGKFVANETEEVKRKVLEPIPIRQEPIRRKEVMEIEKPVISEQPDNTNVDIHSLLERAQSQPMKAKKVPAPPQSQGGKLLEKILLGDIHYEDDEENVVGVLLRTASSMHSRQGNMTNGNVLHQKRGDQMNSEHDDDNNIHKVLLELAMSRSSSRASLMNALPPLAPVRR